MPVALGGTFGPLLDLIYPAGCLCCGSSLAEPEAVLCGRCTGELVFQPSVACERCGSVVPQDEGQCITCSRLHPALERVRSAVSFAGPATVLVHGLKYMRLDYLARFQAELMCSLPQADVVLEEADVLVPVPLHVLRRLRRGYNQSERIAREMAAASGRKLVTGVLARRHRTRTQTRLTPAQRAENVAGAFSSAGNAMDIESRAVLLIDDVMTTGATLSACALAIKDAGADRVFAYTFARA